MHRYGTSWFLAFAIATLAWGCATSVPPGPSADAQRDALVKRALTYKDDARRSPERLAPQRKAELQQLASDVRAWQARTGRSDVRVAERRVTQARRANDGGGPGNCDADCPAYMLDGDSICFLERSECPVDADDGDLTIGTICIYSCISIASEVAPAQQQGQ